MGWLNKNARVFVSVPMTVNINNKHSDILMKNSTTVQLIIIYLQIIVILIYIQIIVLGMAVV